ncbi:hypothetical protein ABZ128_10645 [Streptomyces sp. NPDC006326]|uniref:hypothetical protein n=1 Tax=Streptomyces sp. NPDC006326 TaxID=3156752 RepID=UPI0033AAF411
MGAYEELTPNQRMTNRFHLACLATLIPYHQRPAALDAWLDVDPALFFMGFDPPTPVTEAVLRLGGTRLRAALAHTAGNAATQRALFDLDVPEIDAALLDNHRLGYETRCLLQVRDPIAAATGRSYHQDHHRRALFSGDADLAAAALLDRRGEHPPTARATAWETVRAAGGAARVRALAALLPDCGDPADADVVAACAEADPEPFLDSAAERRLGTGALLRRLRAAHRTDSPPWEVRRVMRSVLKEPYRIDWRLVAAARLGRRLPRTAAEVLRSRPDCPPEVAFVLRTGRPAVPGRPLPPPAPEPEAPQPYRRPSSHWVPPWQPPGDTGPFGDTAESARQALRTMTVVYDAHRDPASPHLGHLGAVLERGQLSAAEAVALIRPASLLTSWVGQQSGWTDVSRAAWSGRSALHVETAALLARWSAGGVPAERWAALLPRLWHFPGTLPELLTEVSAAQPDEPDRAGRTR